MNTRMPDADGTHRLGGIDEPADVAATAPDNHKLARKLLERERDQARQDVAEAAGWVREYERDQAKAEKRLGDAIAAIAWLDDQAGDQR